MPKLWGWLPVPPRPRFGVRLANSRWLDSAVRKSFQAVDVDKTGQIDSKELYIGLLKLYDILNAKLPCHVTIPSTADINRLMTEYDADKSGHLTFEEYLKLCKSLILSRKRWRDSLVLKVAFVVALRVAAFPFLAHRIREGLEEAGVKQAKKVPLPVYALVLEAGVSQFVPL